MTRIIPARCWAVAWLVVMLTATWPPVQAQSSARGVSSDGSGSVVLRGEWDEGERWLSPAALAPDSSDPADIVRASRLGLSRTWGRVHTFGSPGTESHRHIASGISRTPLPAGDLTGDGVPDVLMVEESHADHTVHFRAIDGTDGSEVWTIAPSRLQAGFPLMPGDITGDGAADVVLLTLRTHVEADEICAVACAGSHEWSLTVHSGRDGSMAWSNAYAGTFTEAGASSTGLVSMGAGAFDASNVLVLPLLSGDHDGDGGRDLVVNAFDMSAAGGAAGTNLLIAGAGVGAAGVMVTTRADLVAGSSCDSLFSRTADPRPEGAILLAPGDSVGDPTPDLLWEAPAEVSTPGACGAAVAVVACAQLTDYDNHLEIIDGQTLDITWSTTRSGENLVFSVAVPLVRDVDGDGGNDIRLIEVHQEPTCVRTALGGDCPVSVDTVVLSGSDGSLMWSQPYAGAPVWIGPVAGSPGDDFMELELLEAPDGSVSIRVVRLDGATGTTLFESVIAVPADVPQGMWLYAFLAGDGDEDGVLDLGLQNYEYPALPGGGSGKGRLVVESGRSAQTLMSRHEADFEWYYPAGDVDGDGIDEITARRTLWTSRQVDVRVQSFPLAGGSVRWSRSELLGLDARTGESLRLAHLVPAGPRTDGTGADVIWWMEVSRSRPEGTVILSRADALEAAGGSSRWVVGDSPL